VKRKQMKAFDTPKEVLKLKPIRVENGEGRELCVCAGCKGSGALMTREQGRITCPDCRGAGMRMLEVQ
jgi:DnaJ-class molecular chaperone